MGPGSTCFVPVMQFPLPAHDLLPLCYSTFRTPFCLFPPSLFPASVFRLVGWAWAGRGFLVLGRALRDQRVFAAPSFPARARVLSVAFRSTARPPSLNRYAFRLALCWPPTTSGLFEVDITLAPRLPPRTFTHPCSLPGTSFLPISCSRTWSPRFRLLTCL